MEDYQIWGFTYLNFGDDNINAITGTKEESDTEFEIPCFDGVAYFKAGCKYYVSNYPKYDELTDEQFGTIEEYCGYKPERGEFGVIMGALGEIHRVSARTYKYYKASFEVLKKDIKKVYI